MTLSDEISIRPATLSDIPDLVQLRRLMFESMGYRDAGQLDAGDIAARDYFAEALPRGMFHAWVGVTADGRVVGSGGVVIDLHPPGPGNLTGKIGYVMNIVTVPASRHQGIARRMMQALLSWLVDQGIQRVALHATEMGRPLYRQLGFADSNEMRLTLG